jgi:O-methyltransferase involved in polyketide biosynthesis
VTAPCDYLAEDFLALLKERGFEADGETLFLWEGNTFYLEEAGVLSVLRRLREGVRNFRVAFDYASDAAVSAFRFAQLTVTNGPRAFRLAFR